MFSEVKLEQDDAGHWYALPANLYEGFINDSDDEELIDSGEFDEKYGKYMLGGDISLIKLYVPQEYFDNLK